jgi:hypothetical protein
MRFGTGNVFLGDGKTFGCADGRFFNGTSQQDDGWQEKGKRIPLL